ncbi:MAG TPA: hypothetical protein VMY06_14830 [Sedimentisphaerales bacterium]|nr:hypothetical protein [Sedimentisphaerales bacterium]HUU15585.1 hypothetical protein [Sedimentisphaerales bacterium]
MSKDKKRTMPKQIQNLMLTEKIPDDRPVLRLINELASVMPGIGPKSAFKNWVLRNLPTEINRLRGNGGQLLGQR